MSLKYGLLEINYGKYTPQFSGFNIGDVVQVICLRDIYRRMGVREEDIVRIDISQLQDYAGEYVLLPIVGIAFGLMPFGIPPFSPKIIPLFIGTHINTSCLTDSQISYIYAHAPIGCRDEYGLKQMQALQIPAYLCGCLTLTYNRTALNPRDGKIYFVDTPALLEDYVPNEYKNRIIRLSHLLPLPSHDMTKDDTLSYVKITENRLSEYADNAALVVSSRLHAIAPCLAMGIPCIFVSENISYRFSFIDKLIKIYTPELFNEIDWHPKKIDYSEFKEELYNLFSSEIKRAYGENYLRYKVSDYYESRKKSDYGSRYVNIVSSLKGKVPDNFSYILWGCGLTGEATYSAITQIFPNSVLHLAVDDFKDGMFHGHTIVKSDEIKNNPKDFVFLANYSGKEAGYDMMKHCGRKEGIEFVYLGTING